MIKRYISSWARLYYAQEKVAQAINQWAEALQLGPNPQILSTTRKSSQRIRGSQ